MSTKRYAEEFKIEAVKQVTERGYSAPAVSCAKCLQSMFAYNARIVGGSGPRAVT